MGTRQPDGIASKNNPIAGELLVDYPAYPLRVDSVKGAAMGEVIETVKTVNSAVRTGLAVVLVGGMGAGGYYGYNLYRDGELKALELSKTKAMVEEQRQEIERKNIAIRERDVKISKLAAAMRALKVTQRVAVLDVIDQKVDEATGEIRTQIEFRELTDDGREIDKPRQFIVPGDEIYVDCLLVKFLDQYVEEADIDKGATLYLFERIFSDKLAPEKGYALDEANDRPKAYATGGKMTAFEKQIWKDFWTLANDPQKASEFGIRAAHGQANHFKAVKGKRYRVEVRASDGMTILPEEPPMDSPSDTDPNRRKF